MRRLLVVATFATVLVGVSSAPGSASTTALPGGTSLSVAIASPAPNAIVPHGAVTVSGTAAIGASAAVKNETVAYVLDVSGSTSGSSGVACDSTPGTDSILVCEKEGVKAVNAEAALATSPVLNSGVAAFSGSATALDVDPAAGVQLLTAPGPNIAAAVNPLVAGGSTSFVAGVGAANTILTSAGAGSAKTIVFLSDGSDTVGGTLPAVPSGTVVDTFAIGGAVCSAGSLSLTAIAALGAAGSSCTQVTDLSDLDNVIHAATAATLDSLQIAVDGQPPTTISNADIDPDLPVTGPASVNYSTVVTLASGAHSICVTANGTDAGGSGSTNECVTIQVADTVVDCSVQKCQATATDGPVATAQFSAMGLTKQVGLRAAPTAAGECGGVNCVTGFDVIFNNTGGTAVGQLIVTTPKPYATPFLKAAVYSDGVKVTRSCLLNFLTRSEVLPCKIILPTLNGGTLYYVRFAADPGLRFR